MTTEEDVSAWLDAHPDMCRRLYTERRKLFLETRDRGTGRDTGSSYQKSRCLLARHLERIRDAGDCLAPSTTTASRPGGTAPGSRAAQTDFSGATPIATSLFSGIHAVFQAGNDAVSSLAFAPQEPPRMLAAGTHVGEVKLLAIDGSNNITQCDGVHSGSVTQLTFSAEGQYLASGGEDKMIRVWRVDTGYCLREFPVVTEVCVVAFHPINSHLLLIGDTACGLACVSVSASDATAVRLFAIGEVAAAVFGHTGSLVFAGTKSGTVEVLELQASRNWDLVLWRSFDIPPLGKTGRGGILKGYMTGLFGRGSGANTSDLVEPVPQGMVYSAWLRELGNPALLVSCMDRAVRVFAWRGMSSDSGSRASWVDRLLEVKGGDALVCQLVLRMPTADVRRSPGPVAFCGLQSSHVVYGGADGSLSLVSMRKQRETERLVAHAWRVTAIRAAVTGDFLASADSSGCVLLWGASPPSESLDADRVRDEMRLSRYDSVAE